MLQFFNKKQGERGFTLIELLVVIAIIGILATIVLVSLSGARTSARNARRVSDLRQIQLGMEAYWDANNQYATTQAQLETVMRFPKDPSGTTGAYHSCYSTTGAGYTFGAKLENAGNRENLQTGSIVINVACVAATGKGIPSGGLPALVAGGCGGAAVGNESNFCVTN